MQADEYGKAFEAGYDMTVRFLISRGAAPDLAEEFAQAAWSRGWERVNQLRKPESVGTWVNSIALNLFRAQARKQVHSGSPLDIGATQDVTTAIDARTALGKCGRRDGLLVGLFYIEGMTTSEIGDRVGLTSGAVRVRLLRTRRKLKHLLRAPRLRPPAGRIDTSRSRANHL